MKLFRRLSRVPLAALTIPRDAHTHLLPGVDDGRFTPATAASLLAAMHARGTQSVALTPHIMAGGWDSAPERFATALTALRTAAATAAVPIPWLTLGAEYMIDEDLAARVGRRGAANATTTANTTDLHTITPGHILIEMSWYAPSPWLYEVVEGIVAAGLTPVLAHPERYTYLADTPATFERLHATGCEFQLNLLSTTGIHGPASLRIMNSLLDRGWYRHVGTDIHSPTQWQQIMNSHTDEKTALAGQNASLWSIAPAREKK